MRWDSLFDDLESQLERGLTAEDIDLEAEEERLRLGRLAVRDRLAAIHHSEGPGSTYQIALLLAGGTRLVVHPVTLGRDWVSADIVDDSTRSFQCIVPLASVVGVSLHPGHVSASLSPQAGDGHPSLPGRLGLAFVLRDLCRRRRPLELMMPPGGLHGTIDRVGRDHLDLAVHEPGSPRRDSAVREIRLVPFAALNYLRL